MRHWTDFFFFFLENTVFTVSPINIKMFLLKSVYLKYLCRVSVGAHFLRLMGILSARPGITVPRPVNRMNICRLNSEKCKFMYFRQQTKKKLIFRVWKFIEIELIKIN